MHIIMGTILMVGKNNTINILKLYFLYAKYYGNNI